MIFNCTVHAVLLTKCLMYVHQQVWKGLLHQPSPLIATPGNAMPTATLCRMNEQANTCCNGNKILTMYMYITSWWVENQIVLYIQYTAMFGGWVYSHFGQMDVSYQNHSKKGGSGGRLYMKAARIYLRMNINVQCWNEHNVSEIQSGMVGALQCIPLWQNGTFSMLRTYKCTHLYANKWHTSCYLGYISFSPSNSLHLQAISHIHASVFLCCAHYYTYILAYYRCFSCGLL